MSPTSSNVNPSGEPEWVMISNEPMNVESKMEEYCWSVCHIAYDKTIKGYILKGRELKTLIKENDKVELDKIAKTNGKEAVRNLIWALMDEAVEQDKGFSSGSMRIDDPDKKIHAFIMECGKHDLDYPIYQRWSTHMNEMSTKDPIQYGYDLPSMTLPAQKRSVLLGHLDDDTTFIKIEKYGYPPFYTHIWRNNKERLGHSYEYLQTRINKGLLKGYDRKEHVPHDILELFKQTLKKYVKDQRSYVESLYVYKESDQLYAEGKKFGISRIQKIIQNKLSTELEDAKSDAENPLTKLNHRIDEIVQEAKSRGYQGFIKGREVTLPFFNSK
jgi:hypothetical protein